MKGKSTWIELKESNNLAKCVSHQIPKIVEPPAIMKDMASSFNWMRSTQIAKVFFQEES